MQILAKVAGSANVLAPLRLKFCIVNMEKKTFYGPISGKTAVGAVKFEV